MGDGDAGGIKGVSSRDQAQARVPDEPRRGLWHAQQGWFDARQQANQEGLATNEEEIAKRLLDYERDPRNFTRAMREGKRQAMRAQRFQGRRRLTRALL
jgi:hypothetical protein